MTEEKTEQNQNPISLAPVVVEMKIKSEDAEAVLKSEIDKVMKSEKFIELSKKAEDSRLEYEMKKIRLMELMIESKVNSLKLDGGHSVRLMINGDKKTIKVTPKR